MSKPNILIVNEQDEVIGSKARGTLCPTDIYRVAALWITTSTGDVLLARRNPSKQHHPNMWGPAVAGTVDVGESYESNIIKEMKEEIGLTQIHLDIGPKRFTTGEYQHFTQWFVATVDAPISKFTIDPNEVSEVRWFTHRDLLDQLRKKPNSFLPHMREYLALFV